MSLLLDTHAVLWYALDDSRLSAIARMAIDNEADRVYISPASYWEIAIKIGRGRYVLSEPFDDFWQRAITRENFTVLPVEIRHAARVSTLTPIHSDPFDRMIIAQALVEGVQLVSNESLFDRYNVQRIW